MPSEQMMSCRRQLGKNMLAITKALALDVVLILNSLAREFCLDQGDSVQGIVSQLEQIQCLLQDIGSNIATPRDSATAPRLARTEFDSDGQHVQDLENWIDAMDQELPPLTCFILPVSNLVPVKACYLNTSSLVGKLQLPYMSLDQSAAGQREE
ncbi:hypothetical protein BGZ50_003130 [Haplosporangium sp. Z 11]|nr:hypothetical protein BGZ50_003130 [Haplosporangium sp. Z 11]